MQLRLKNLQVQTSTIGSYKFVREAEATEFVLFSAPGKGKLHENRNNRNNQNKDIYECMLELITNVFFVNVNVPKVFFCRDVVK